VQYRIEFSESALRELARLSPEVARRITSKIGRLKDDLAGNVKRLTNYSPEYRLRVGDWRVLFDVRADTVIIQHVSHRSQAYD
jgi:mRNA interferase RelE/StbE